MTAKERRMLDAIINSEYQSSGDGTDAVWTEYVMEACGGTKANAGVMASLVKKGFAGTTGNASANSRNPGTCWATEAGVKAFKEAV